MAGTRRVFARLDPAEFGRRFLSWLRAMVPDTVGQVVALGGKAALHMVSAWACGSGLVLGQLAIVFVYFLYLRLTCCILDGAS